MKWKNRIEKLRKKLRKMMHILRNLNKVLELPKIRQVYLALVESIISYGIIDWSGAFENTISHLQICQNQIIRL
jgi:predicted component of type VI protein secretion system